MAVVGIIGGGIGGLAVAWNLVSPVYAFKACAATARSRAPPRARATRRARSAAASSSERNAGSRSTAVTTASTSLASPPTVSI